MGFTRKRRILLTAGLLLAGTTSWCSAGQWDWTTGAVFRGFGDLELKNVEFATPSWGAPAGAETFLDGYATSSEVGVALYNVPQVMPGGTLVYLHSVDSLPQPEGDIGSGTGVFLKASRALENDWRLDCSLLWIGSNTDQTARHLTLTETPYIATGGGGSVAWVPATPGDYPGTGTATSGQWAQGATSDQDYGQIDYDLDLDLFTLGLGLRRDVTSGDLSLQLAAGPTVSVVSQEASWRGQVVIDDTVLFSQEENDDDIDFALGAYGEITGAYEISDGWSIQLGMRYDFIQETSTDYSDIDPSGLTGEIGVTCEF